MFIPFGTKIPWPVPAPETPPKSAGLKKERRSLPMLMPETKRFLLSALATAAVLLAVYGMCQYIGMTIGLVVLAVLVAIFTVGVHAAETNQPLLHESAGAATVAVKLGLLIPTLQILGRGNLGWLILVPYAVLLWHFSSSIGRRIGKSDNLLIVSTGAIVTFVWLGMRALIGHLQASG